MGCFSSQATGSHRSLVIILMAITLILSFNMDENTTRADTGPASVGVQFPSGHGFRFAGYYAAVEKGFYQEEGLSVSLSPGHGPETVAESLYRGGAEYGVMEPDALVFREKGTPVVLLASILQKSTWNVVVKQDSTIYEVKDLVEKRVASQGGRGPLLSALLREGIDRERIQFYHDDDGMEKFTSGEVDALAGDISILCWQLKQAGIPFRIISLKGTGGIFYGDSLFASTREITKYPQRVAGFIRASLKGWEYALAHPMEMAIVMQDRYGVTESMSRIAHDAQVIQRMVLSELIPLGDVNPQRWERMARTYQDMGVLGEGFSLAEFFYNPDGGDSSMVPMWVVPTAVALLLLGGLAIFLFHQGQTPERLFSGRIKGLEGILTSASDIAIHGCNGKMEVIFWNPACEKQYGIRRDRALGRPLDELIVPPPMRDQAREGFVKWIHSTQAGTPEVMHLMDGKGEPVTVFAVPMVHHTSAGVVIFRFDINMAPLQQAEQERIAAQRIAWELKRFAVVGRVAGKIAHDFNNILGAIMGNAELTLMDCRDPEIREVLNLIYEQTLKGKNLTQNLMAFAKDQELKPEFFNPAEKLDLVLTLLRKDLKGIRLRTLVEPEMPEILADPGMVENALVNIIQNSVQALSKTSSPRMVIRCHSRGQYLYWEVEDNGCGIPEQHVQRIYEPGFTLKGKKDIVGAYATEVQGAGYGMANVRKWVAQHKGEISIQTREGEGTTVVIRLPVITRTMDFTEKQALNPMSIQPGKRILLVEDEKAISQLFKQLLTLEPFGHHVDVAESGREALELFQSREYDVVSLDYILAGEMNGLDVYTRIRELNKTIPVLFISGNLEFLESIKALKDGDKCMDHLSKPCRHREYINTLHSLISQCAVA